MLRKQHLDNLKANAFTTTSPHLVLTPRNAVTLYFVIEIKVPIIQSKEWSRTLLNSCSFWELFWVFRPYLAAVVWDIMPGFHTVTMCMIFWNKRYRHFLPSLCCLYAVAAIAWNGVWSVQLTDYTPFQAVLFCYWGAQTEQYFEWSEKLLLS